MAIDGEAGQQAHARPTYQNFGVGMAEHCLTMGPRLAGRRGWLALLAGRPAAGPSTRPWMVYH